MGISLNWAAAEESPTKANSGSFLPGIWSAPVGEALRGLPVQDAGRIKPFDSFARELLEMIYGKTTLEGKPAYEVVLTWLLSPQAWQGKELFEVRNHEVLKGLGLDPERRYFKGEEIFSNERFSTLRQELQEKRESKEKLTPYFQSLGRLENQFYMFTEMASGRLLKLVPEASTIAQGAAAGPWVGVDRLEGETQAAFMVLSRKFIERIGVMAQKGSHEDLLRASEELDLAVGEFKRKARESSPNLYPSDGLADLEVHYNLFHPFRWSYIFYLLAAFLLLFVWITDKGRLMPGVWALFGIGFLLHIYGFGLRVYLAGRAPVSNMYETVVWVSFGSVLFAAILEIIYRFKFILLAGLCVGIFGMVVAGSAPAILDPSLQPLEPVLRSNYWLTIHVMTITISYAAFFLAMMLGDMALFYTIRGEVANREKLKALTLAIYRAKQIGVSFLAPGIILGGIWADYSWGRFWGWDPKETWALIVLLGYIAVLHGRMVGWIRDFGMAVSAVLTFSLVIMAWYGVNFVLGAGLHSYGFGAGGIEYVAAFVFLHFLFVVYTVLVRRARAQLQSQTKT
ncbi:MAG: cytochrome c biogenesis protein CcsA [Bdellovibrionaceae bacterium]|nr:cytochrome c biogenesis protein CcsA [Pseudobdellovibrionaceae bacterium]